jgi:ABC-2 type transport system ATP-binding protein
VSAFPCVLVHKPVFIAPNCPQAVVRQDRSANNDVSTPDRIAFGRMSEPLIETKDLTKRYGELAALDGCSLTVSRGEIFGLLGPNGAGKTTLIRLLLGFLKPTSGTAKIGSLDCVRQSVDVRKLVSYLPAEAQLFGGMQGKEVLQFFARLRPGGDFAQALKLAERLELDLRRRVAFMSTGMRQKLAFAATMSADAQLYILDEPTANLDPTVRNTVLAIANESRALGRTVLFSSHVLSEVEEVCDRVAILRAGKIVHAQSLEDLRTQHRIIAQLTGPFVEAPAELRSQITIKHRENGAVTFETAAALPPVLGWLATLPLADMRIEPVGLRSVYDRFHGGRL